MIPAIYTVAMLGLLGNEPDERSGGHTDCAACDGNGCDRCMPHLFEDEGE